MPRPLWICAGCSLLVGALTGCPPPHADLGTYTAAATTGSEGPGGGVSSQGEGVTTTQGSGSAATTGAEEMPGMSTDEVATTSGMTGMSGVTGTAGTTEAVETTGGAETGTSGTTGLDPTGETEGVDESSGTTGAMPVVCEPEAPGVLANTWMCSATPSATCPRWTTARIATARATRTSRRPSSRR